MRGANLRNRRIAEGFRRIADAYAKYSSEISGLDNKGIDPEVIKFIFQETVITQKLGKICDGVSNSSAAGGGVLRWEEAVNEIKRIADDSDVEREALRVTLGLKYNLSFPTLDETSRETKDLANKKKSGTSASDNPERSKMRTWTDSTGRFKIKAKCIGLEDGKVKLEKPDGTVITVPLDKLSESDKRFLASTG